MHLDELREEVEIELDLMKDTVLFDEKIKSKLAPFRKFRHVVHHGYGFQLEWERMLPGILIVEEIFKKFKEVVSEYLKNLTIHRLNLISKKLFE